MEQTVIRIYGNPEDGSDLDEYLNDGWVIKQISAAGTEKSTYCYFLLERENKKS